MPKIIHFEISADDPARASGFYESVFDWRVDKWEGPVEYWLISMMIATRPAFTGDQKACEPLATEAVGSSDGAFVLNRVVSHSLIGASADRNNGRYRNDRVKSGLMLCAAQNFLGHTARQPSITQ